MFKLLSGVVCALVLSRTVLAEPSVADVNPYIGTVPIAVKSYAKKLDETIATFNRAGDSLNAARTRTVQKTPTFAWISQSRDIPTVKDLVSDALAEQQATGKKQLVQLVVYNLPDRDCSAKASDGEFHLINDGLNKYKGYIDAIVAQLTTAAAKQVSFSIIIEPDSLGNLITNLHIEKCAGAAEAYKEGVSYAIAKLQLPNAALYLDAAHGGWLGWDENLAPSAAAFRSVLDGARKIVPGATVRGLAINVSNYNQYVATVREPFTEWSPSWDESHYVQSLAPHLVRAGYPAHFIVDQGRAGKAGIRTTWAQWCNLRGAGFGTRPTADQSILKNNNVDAIVWVKPGGESDGTSDRNAVRFDENCQSPVAHVPAPEAGDWFNDFVVNMVKNANPALEPTW